MSGFVANELSAFLGPFIYSLGPLLGGGDAYKNAQNAARKKIMLRLAVRGMSLILGLGLLVGGVWGPQFKPDILIAAIALILSATLSSIRLKQLWVLPLALSGNSLLADPDHDRDHLDARRP